MHINRKNSLQKEGAWLEDELSSQFELIKEVTWLKAEVSVHSFFILTFNYTLSG